MNQATDPVHVFLHVIDFVFNYPAFQSALVLGRLWSTHGHLSNLAVWAIAAIVLISVLKVGLQGYVRGVKPCILREVGLVRVRENGRQRHYALDARGLNEVHEWTGGFERFWRESFERLDEYVGELQEMESDDAGG